MRNRFRRESISSSDGVRIRTCLDYTGALRCSDCCRKKKSCYDVPYRNDKEVAAASFALAVSAIEYDNYLSVDPYTSKEDAVGFPKPNGFDAACQAYVNTIERAKSRDRATPSDPRPVATTSFTSVPERSRSRSPKREQRD